MAAFFKYICQFESCQKRFNSLFDLINHIEYSHISRDPKLLKQQELSQPPAVALSYVNCFFSEHFKNTPVDSGANLPSNFTVKRLGKNKLFEKNRLNDSLESMLDESDTLSDAGSDDSCHSWSTTASSSAFNVGSHNENIIPSSSNTFTNITASITTESLQGKFTCLEDNEGKKRFLCTVPGCTKKYKNINGIKYHVKNGHNKKETLTGEVKKNYLCHCGKAYKSQSGLRHHQNTQHNANPVSSGAGSSTSNSTVSSSFLSNLNGKKLDHNFHSQKPQSLPPVAEMCPPTVPLAPEIAI